MIRVAAVRGRMLVIAVLIRSGYRIFVAQTTSFLAVRRSTEHSVVDIPSRRIDRSSINSALVAASTVMREAQNRRDMDGGRLLGFPHHRSDGWCLIHVRGIRACGRYSATISSSDGRWTPRVVVVSRLPSFPVVALCKGDRSGTTTTGPV